MSDWRGPRFWLRWVLANCLGELVGLGAAFGIGAALVAHAGEPASALLILAYAAVAAATGALEGFVVGLAQSWAMRPILPQMPRRAWVGATVLGAMIAWILGMLPSTLIGLSGPSSEVSPAEPEEWIVYLLAMAMGVVAGIILGLPQWAVLRRWIGRAGWWIGANALAWAGGMPVVFAGTGQLFGGDSGLGAVLPFLGTLATAGAVVGAIHGAGLWWLVRYRGDPSPR